MNTTVLLQIFGRAPAERALPPRRDSGAAGIVILMMALVFVPIVVAHLIAASESGLGGPDAGHIASFMHLLLPQSMPN